MKKMWTKFKRWLIKKLGGYIEGPHMIKTYHIEPVCITAAIKGVRRDTYHSDPGYKEYAERALLSNLSNYLYDHREHIIYISESIDPLDLAEDQTISLRADIKVLPNG